MAYELIQMLAKKKGKLMIPLRFLIVLFISSLPLQALANTPAWAVRTSFEELKLALQSGQGLSASKLVTSGTIAMYEEGRKLALSSEGIDLEATSQTVVLLMFQLRYLSNKKELEKMNGLEVFSWGVANGLVKRDVLAAISLDKVQVEKDEAFATLLKNGSPLPDFLFRFKKQNNQWKLAMNEITKATEIAFKNLREKSGKSKIELAIFIMERTYGKSIPPSILNGPLR